MADTTKNQCIEANSSGQELRRQGKLSAAREQLRRCVDVACPGLVRDDCTRRLDELEKVQPTIVFIARDASGSDVTNVAVTLDGKPLADKLDGSELPVDPGEHVFTFTRAGQAPVSATLVLAPGEKDRRETISLTPGAPAVASQGQGTHLVVAVAAEATVSIDGQVVGRGRFDGHPPPGSHAVSITETGMQPYKAEVELRDGETRTLQVTLEPEHHAPVWPWIVGGAALAVGAVVGGYFLFKPSDTVTPVPPGQIATATFTAWRP